MASNLPIAQTIARNAKRYSINNQVFPEDIGAHGMLFMFRNYTYSTSKVSTIDTSSTLNQTIVLPLPRNLEDNLSLRIDRYEQGIFGDSIARAVDAADGGKSIMAGVDAMTNTISGMLPGGRGTADAIGAIAQGGELPSQALSRLSFLARTTLDKMGAARNVDVGLGTTVNPKAALFFEGVTLKTHTFDWQFMPRSSGESESLKNILNMFRKHSLPRYLDVVGETGVNGPLQRALFQYPSIVEVKLLGVDENHYMRFKPMMVTGLNINYSPQGQAVLKGGKPAAVTVNISLMETDIWTQFDYGVADGKQVDSDLDRATVTGPDGPKGKEKY